MQSITTKRGFTYYAAFSVWMCIALAGCYAVGTCVYDILADDYEKKQVAIIIIGVAIIALGLFGISLLNKKAFVFTVTKDIFKAKGRRYAIADIENISFTGIQHHDGFGHLEGMKITFKNNTVFMAFDQYYSNIAEVKRFLEHIWLGQTPPENPIVIQPVEDKMFRGSFKGTVSVLIFLLVVALVIPFLKVPVKLKWIGLVILLMPYILLLSECSYFGIKNNNFEIKKFALPGYKKTYPLKEIREIVLESHPKRPYGLRIILKDYSATPLSYAGTFTTSHWKALIAHVQQAGIPIRDQAGLTRQN